MHQQGGGGGGGGGGGLFLQGEQTTLQPTKKFKNVSNKIRFRFKQYTYNFSNGNCLAKRIDTLENEITQYNVIKRIQHF